MSNSNQGMYTAAQRRQFAEYVWYISLRVYRITLLLRTHHSGKHVSRDNLTNTLPSQTMVRIMVELWYLTYMVRLYIGHCKLKILPTIKSG